MSGALVGSGLLFAAPAQAAEETIGSHEVDLSETRAKGHNEFGPSGVRVWTETSDGSDPRPGGGTWYANKAAGYFLVNTPLADAGEPSMAWTAADPAVGNLKPSVQLKTDFDGDGNIDGILVGEPTYADGSPLYGNDWWLSNGSEQFVKDAAPSHTGGFGSENHGTLDQWRTAFGGAKIIQAGWSLGSGVQGDGTIGSITVGETVYSFAEAPEPTTETLYENDVDLQHTRVQGHNEFLEEGGVRVRTDAPAGYASKAAGYFPVDLPLADAGTPALDFTNEMPEGPVPGLQLVVDLDADGTEDGTLVGEPLYPGLLWMAGSTLAGAPVAQEFKDAAPRQTGQDGAPGYSAGAGTLAEWQAAFPDGVITQGGWSLGSNAVGRGVINAITIGLTDYTFTGANRAPVAEDVEATGVTGRSATVRLKGTDADGDELTYAAEDGAVVGDRLTIEFTDTTVGTREVAFTVSDGEDTDEGTVTFTVTPARSSSELVVRPEKVRSNMRARAIVRVESDGMVASGRVEITDGGEVVGKGRLATNGKVVIQMKRLDRGRHRLVAEFLGTNYAKPSKDSVWIVVR